VSALKYFIGIDGGGTNSRLLAVDQSYNFIGNAFGGSTNLASNSKEFVYNNLKNIVDKFLKKSNMKIEDCVGICIGSAGIDSVSSSLAMEQILKVIGFTCRIIAVNDSLLALAAVTKGGPGVVVISGTGSIAYGMDSNGKSVRCGGWGHILDDCGSAYWMGKEALKCALRSYDGRGEKTILEEIFQEEFQIENVSDCMERVYYRFDKAEIAGYALYVKEGAARKDNVCMKIIDTASKELFILADTVIKKIKEDSPVVIVSGGAILNNDILFSSFRMHMDKHYPGIKVIKINKEPVMGAIHLIVSQVEELIC